MMTEEETHIGLNKLNALDRINLITNSDFLITGSLSLYLYGVIDRKVKDIDILLPDLKLFSAILKAKAIESTTDFNYDENKRIENQEISQIRFKVNEIWCCAFPSNKDNYKSYSFSVGRSFNVAHPKGSIEAKKRYVFSILKKELPTHRQNERLKKHMLDIVDYNKWQHKNNPATVGINVDLILKRQNK